ncbi:MAG: family 1 glycosylhydrolase [Candidatus Levybacteria bacterium]|nr:family 1 glycosylhydrolase [Candidatus Levybacteria bacterium]
MENNILEFPKEFLFGSSVAAFQVEGNLGERRTDWDIFIRQNSEIIKPGQVGPLWWEEGVVEKDIETMSTLGLKMQRISFEWGRIEPEKGHINFEAIKRYKEIIGKIVELRMVPMVTLNHYVLPQWIAKEGSWNSRKTVGYFAHYVKFMVGQFPEVGYWLTLNEPNIQLIVAYLTRYTPPQKGSLLATLNAYRNMISAHKRAYYIIKELQPHSQVSMAFAFRWDRPENPKDYFEKKYTKIVNYFSQLVYIWDTQKTLDYVGCNFYTGYFLDLDLSKIKISLGPSKERIPQTILFGEMKEPNAYVSDYGWPIVPDFLLNLLRYIHRYFPKKPIIITENGIADHKDEHRAFYILTHLVAMWQAMKEGIPVKHYVHWSTVDNLEWTEGYSKKFGLIALDPITGERKLRKSAHLYKEIATSGKIHVKQLIDTYLEGEQKIKADEIITKLLKGEIVYDTIGTVPDQYGR